MANKYNILFYLKSEKERNDRYLRCRVRWDNQCVYLNVGYRVEQDKWNTNTQRCVKSSTHGKRKIQAGTINRAIENLERDIETYFMKCESAGEEPTVEQLQIALGNEPDDREMLDIFDIFMNTVGVQKSWTKAQYCKMRSLRNHLHAFDPSISFARLNDDVLFNFISYLQSPTAMQMKYHNINEGLKNTTISRMLGFFRHFLRWANEHGYYKGNLHNTFHPHLKGLDVKTIIYLEWSELMNFLNYDFSKYPMLDISRDIFCFSSFTALRYSDLMRLSWADVNLKNNEINIVVQKTSKRNVVVLNKFARSIIDRHNSHNCGNSDKIFPYLHNVMLNRYIKDAAKLAGIDTPVHLVYYVGGERIERVVPKYKALSIHGGRRTFTVNALSMGTSIFTVKEIGGWANINSMKPYAALINAAKRDALNKFDTWDGSIV